MDLKASLQLPNVHQGIPNSGRATKRVYQVWKGNNRFFCGGRLVFGPDVRSLLLTLFLILAPIVVFCVLVGGDLLKDFPNHEGVAIMVVAVTCTCIVLSILLLTSGRDPGIIPRNPHPPELGEEEGSSSSDWSGTHTPKPRLPRTKDVIVNGVVVKTKYCDTCMLYRPPRCSHCSVCNNCVERFDHHCPWVGQCIGQRNYRYFFLFILSSTLLCFFIFAMCALRIKKIMDGDPPHTVWKAFQRSPASAALMAYAFLATWFVGGLTVFHSYLIATNQTTYENFRHRYENTINPYDKGIARNVKEILCSPIPPSKVNFRAGVQEQPSGFGSFLARQSEHMDVFSPSMSKQREHMDILGPKMAKQRGHMDISSPKKAKPLDNMETGLKPTWTNRNAHKFAEEMEVAHNAVKGLNKEARHGFHDPSMERLGNPYAQEWQDATREITHLRNSSLGVRNEVTYPRHSSWAREGSMAEVVPQMPPSVARQGSLGWPAAPFTNQ